MDPRPVKKPERRKMSHEALLAAAQKLFVSHGFRQTTVDQIAKSAKLSKGSVYFHFKSKTDVLLKLLDRTEKIVLHPIIEVNQNDSYAPDEKLAVIINKQAMLGVTHPNEVLLLILTSLEMNRRVGSIAKKVDLIYDSMYEQIEKIILDGQKKDVFCKDITAREASAIVVASYDGTFLEWHRTRSKLDGEELARALRRVMLNGLRTK
jgi:AcrR family transcriptional regulator